MLGTASLPTTGRGRGSKYLKEIIAATSGSMIYPMNNKELSKDIPKFSRSEPTVRKVEKVSPSIQTAEVSELKTKS